MILLLTIITFLTTTFMGTLSMLSIISDKTRVSATMTFGRGLIAVSCVILCSGIKNQHLYSIEMGAIGLSIGVALTWWLHLLDVHKEKWAMIKKDPAILLLMAVYWWKTRKENDA